MGNMQIKMKFTSVTLLRSPFVSFFVHFRTYKHVWFTFLSVSLLHLPFVDIHFHRTGLHIALQKNRRSRICAQHRKILCFLSLTQDIYCSMVSCSPGRGTFYSAGLTWSVWKYFTAASACLTLSHHGPATFLMHSCTPHICYGLTELATPFDISLALIPQGSLIGRFPDIVPYAISSFRLPL